MSVECYERVIELNPKDERAYNSLGDVYYMEKDYDQAIKNYKISIELNPKYALAYFNLGVVFDGLDQIEKAIESYEKAIQLDPKDAFAYNNLGMTYIRERRFNKAEALFDKAIQLDNKSININGSLIHFYISQNKLKKAKTQLAKILALQKEKELNNVTNVDILTPMLKHLNPTSIEKFTKTLINQFAKANELNTFYDAFPTTIFKLLINIEDFEKEKYQFIKKHLNEVFAGVDKMKISLLLLNVGIRYLTEGDKRALFDLSKEERKVFTDFVLKPREEKGK